jgi:hypothetical protein
VETETAFAGLLDQARLGEGLQQAGRLRAVDPGGRRGEFRIGVGTGDHRQQPVEASGRRRQRLVGNIERSPHGKIAVDAEHRQPVPFVS